MRLGFDGYLVCTWWSFPMSNKVISCAKGRALLLIRNKPENCTASYSFLLKNMQKLEMTLGLQVVAYCTLLWKDIINSSPQKRYKYEVFCSLLVFVWIKRRVIFILTPQEGRLQIIPVRFLQCVKHTNQVIFYILYLYMEKYYARWITTLLNQINGGEQVAELSKTFLYRTKHTWISLSVIWSSEGQTDGNEWQRYTRGEVALSHHNIKTKQSSLTSHWKALF